MYFGFTKIMAFFQRMFLINNMLYNIFYDYIIEAVYFNVFG